MIGLPHKQGSREGVDTTTMTYVCLVLMEFFINFGPFITVCMMCFIELLKRVGHNYNSPVDPTVCTRLRELHISWHDWHGCRGGRKLPRRGGDVSNGSEEATYDGPEEVNQSDTVSIPAVTPGQPLPTRVIASADPHAICSPVVHPLEI